MRAGDYLLDETEEPVRSLGERLVSANAYLGAGPIVEALAGGADIVITGRAADPAMFLAPQIHEFGWSMDDWTRLGRGTVLGHLLECAGQITGGYFADPGHKDVPDLARLGFPIGEVTEDGSAVITKVHGSGGLVTTATCTEQLLYEVHDPARYFQPDVVADFSQVQRDRRSGPDRVRVAGGDGQPRTGSLKVSLGYVDSFVGEGQISYAGPGALARGRLALDIVAERLRLTGLPCSETRFDLIGVDAILGPKLSTRAPGAGGGARRVYRAHRQPRGGDPDRQRGRIPLPQRAGRRRRRHEVGARSGRRGLDAGTRAGGQARRPDHGELKCSCAPSPIPGPGTKATSRTSR